MRKTELQQLLGFTDFVWGEFRGALTDSQLSMVAEGSGWPTLRHCLAHMVLAHERWLPAIVELKAGSMREVGPDDFKTWREIDSLRSGFREELRSRLESWSDEDLALMQEVDVGGTVVRYSRGELIAHLLLHERAHHGDVTTLMWQLGLDTDLASEYRFFLGRHET